MPDTPAIAVVFPVRNAAARLPALLADWDRSLRESGRDYSLVVVDDGSTDGTATAANELAAKLPRLTVLTHEKPQGFGACLRTALPACTAPLVAHVLADYPYQPADLTKLIARLDQPCEVYDQQKFSDAAAGCRSGRPTPTFWKLAGRAYRLFVRVALGANLEPAPGWLGFREHARSWAIWLTMGVPLADVTSGLKVFRRSVFDRFPIQSDGDAAHAEIFAKLTFLTTLVAEETLAPSPDPVPATHYSWLGLLARAPQFVYPLPDLSRPA